MPSWKEQQKKSQLLRTGLSLTSYWTPFTSFYLGILPNCSFCYQITQRWLRMGAWRQKGKNFVACKSKAFMKSLFLNSIIVSHRNPIPEATHEGRTQPLVKISMLYPDKVTRTHGHCTQTFIVYCSCSKLYHNAFYLHSTKEAGINVTSFPITFTHTLSPTSTISDGLSTRQEDMWVLWTRPGQNLGGKKKENEFLHH